MFQKVFIIFIMTLVFGLSTPSWSYDVQAAKAYSELFADVKGKASGKNLHLIPADKFLEKIKSQKPLVVLDVRTPKESEVFGFRLAGSLNIPLNELFTPKSLASLPKDKPIIVFCQSGIRSTAAGTALRHIGFKNVFIVKGGLKALITYLGPKEAYTPMKTTSNK
ncbi:MAG: rhodanese-like domain-containing protein [Gammaproteobacteria bacterium]|jgi:rhodanese-related sulfurtransferase